MRSLYREKQLLVHGLREQGLLPPSLSQGLPSYPPPVLSAGDLGRPSSYSSIQSDEAGTSLSHITAPTTLSHSTSTLPTSVVKISSSSVTKVRRSSSPADTSATIATTRVRQVASTLQTTSAASEVDQDALEDSSLAADHQWSRGRVSSSGLPSLTTTRYCQAPRSSDFNKVILLKSE
jgi:hypothetical protein